MATRQEMVCAINLIRHTARANRHLESLIKVLDGTTILINEQDKPVTFEEGKQAAKKGCEVAHDLTGKIKIVVEKADPAFLDNGIADVSLKVAHNLTRYLRNDISSDVDNVYTGSYQAEQSINLSAKKEDLKAIASGLKTIDLKTGIVEPNPWGLFPTEVNHTNILHDILDALSYELQGRNSYTGQLQLLTEQQKEKLFNNRIFTADIYLSKLSNSNDKQMLKTILAYIKVNITKATDAFKLANIGKYIDSELPKLIMVRRWWAL